MFLRLNVVSLLSTLNYYDMKRVFTIAACVAFALLSVACQSKFDISVISYNVRVDTSVDGDNRWECRRHASLNMIRAEQPTIFGVQEAMPHQYQYLKDSLPQYGSYGIGREDGQSWGEHMAIFYHKDFVELLDCGTFWLSETPDVPSHGWDAMCKRTCTWVRLKLKTDGREFVYMNTHLDHVGEQARRESLRMITQRITELAPNGEPVILTADFNSTVDNPIYDTLRTIRLDTRAIAPESDSRATLNCWRTDKTDDPTWVIDHVFVRGVEAQSFRVLDGDYGAPFISDHYPVLMRGRM